MNEANLEKWINELRYTSLPQADDELCRNVTDEKGNFTGEVGYCCLGIGELLSGKTTGQLVARSLVDRSFLAWLGLEPIEDEESFDIVLDWPDELKPRKSEKDISAVVLNDVYHLTFPQIADCIEYFGIKEATA